MEILKSHEEEMHVEDLAELKEEEEEQEEEQLKDITEPWQLTMKRLIHFVLADQLAQEVVDVDPSLMQSIHFRRGLTPLK